MSECEAGKGYIVGPISIEAFKIHVRVPQTFRGLQLSVQPRPPNDNELDLHLYFMI